MSTSVSGMGYPAGVSVGLTADSLTTPEPTHTTNAEPHTCIVGPDVEVGPDKQTLHCRVAEKRVEPPWPGQASNAANQHHLIPSHTHPPAASHRIASHLTAPHLISDLQIPPGMRTERGSILGRPACGNRVAEAITKKPTCICMRSHLAVISAPQADQTRRMDIENTKRAGVIRPSAGPFPTRATNRSYSNKKPGQFAQSKRGARGGMYAPSRKRLDSARLAGCRRWRLPGRGVMDGDDAVMMDGVVGGGCRASSRLTRLCLSLPPKMANNKGGRTPKRCLGWDDNSPFSLPSPVTPQTLSPAPAPTAHPQCDSLLLSDARLGGLLSSQAVDLASERDREKNENGGAQAVPQRAG